MKKLLIIRGAAIAFLLAPHLVSAEVPGMGVQPDAFANRERVSCDEFDQLKALYNAGKNNFFFIRSTMEVMVKEAGPNQYGDPVCTVRTYPNVKVLGAVYLGPIDNFIGDAKLGFYAVHVDTSPYGQTATDFWILWLDEQTGLG